MNLHSSLKILVAPSRLQAFKFSTYWALPPADCAFSLINIRVSLVFHGCLLHETGGTVVGFQNTQQKYSGIKREF